MKDPYTFLYSFYNNSEISNRIEKPVIRERKSAASYKIEALRLFDHDPFGFGPSQLRANGGLDFCSEENV